MEEILYIPDDSYVGCFVEVDFKLPDEVKEKPKNFPVAPEKKFNPDDLSDYMKRYKTDTYAQTKKLICGCSDKKNYLIQYRIIKFYVRLGMVVEKIHAIISFDQSKWLEKYISFNTQKRNRAKKEFDKDLYKIPVNAVFGSFLENFRN